MPWPAGIGLGVWAAGGISGGHINPAVTLTFATYRGFSWRKVPGYILSQVLGALLGAALTYATYFHAQVSFFVLVVTVSLATWEIDAKASPLNPYVVIRDRSEKVDIFEVVKRSARMGKSAFCSETLKEMLWCSKTRRTRIP